MGGYPRDTPHSPSPPPPPPGRSTHHGSRSEMGVKPAATRRREASSTACGCRVEEKRECACACTCVCVCVCVCLHVCVRLYARVNTCQPPCVDAGTAPRGSTAAPHAHARPRARVAA